MLRGAIGVAGGAVLAGCGTTARNVEPNVPVGAASQTPLPQPTSTITPLPRYVPTTAPTATLAIRGGAFSPKVLAVAPGTVIRFVNADGELHAIVPSEGEEHALRSSDVGPGNSVHMTAPDTPGEYNYYCMWHSWIASEKGSIVVTTDVASADALNQQNGVNGDEDPGEYTPPPSTASPGATSTPSSTYGSTPSSTPYSESDSDPDSYE